MNETCPNGMIDYCNRARSLLEESAAGVNPFATMKP